MAQIAQRARRAKAAGSALQLRGDVDAGEYATFIQGIVDQLRHFQLPGKLLPIGAADIYVSSEDANAGLTLPTLFVMSIDSETLTGSISGRLCKPTTVEPYCAFIEFDLEFRSKHQFRGPGCNVE